MRRIKRIAWILTLAILLTLTVPALAASSVQNEVQGSAAYMVSAVKSPEVGSIGGEVIPHAGVRIEVSLMT